MDRATLFILLILDLFVMGGSTYVLYNRFKDAKEPAPIVMMEQAPAPAATPPEIPEALPAEDPEIQPEAEPIQQQHPKKISFRYRDAVSKRVAIVGAFSQWKPKPMKRGKGATWTVTLNLAPGKYAYNFLVDGKMIRDPSNPRSVSAGRKIKSSLVVVRSK
jgi:hypothetical protein